MKIYFWVVDSAICMLGIVTESNRYYEWVLRKEGGCGQNLSPLMWMAYSSVV
jgi:hypothetical protein